MERVSWRSRFRARVRWITNDDIHLDPSERCGDDFKASGLQRIHWPAVNPEVPFRSSWLALEELLASGQAGRLWGKRAGGDGPTLPQPGSIGQKDTLVVWIVHGPQAASPFQCSFPFFLLASLRLLPSFLTPPSPRSTISLGPIRRAFVFPASARFVESAGSLHP